MPTASNPTDPPRVLLLSQCLLGDTLALLPALHALRSAFPAARIELVSDEQGPGRVRAADVLTGRGLVDGCHGLLARGSLARKAWNRALLLARLRRTHWDAGLVLLPPYPPLTAALVRRLERYLRLAGVRRRSLPVPEPHRRGPDGFLERAPHVSDRLVEQMALLGIAVPPYGNRSFALPPAAHLDPAHAAAVRLTAACEPQALRLALAPGSNMPCKCWPLERYVEVLRALAGRLPLAVFVFGSRAEADVGAELQARLPGMALHLVFGEPIHQVAEVLRQCDLYLGNDTGLMHLAVAVGKPCVAVFSSRDVPGAWEPYGTGHTVLRTQVACEGCLAADCPLGTYACIRAITAEAVTGACLDAAARASRRRAG